MQLNYLKYIRQHFNEQFSVYLLVGECTLLFSTLDHLVNQYQENQFEIEKYVLSENEDSPQNSQNLSLFAQKRLLIFYCNQKEQLKSIAEQLDLFDHNTHLIILFLDYKTSDKRQKWFQKLDKKGLIIQHFALKSEEIKFYINHRACFFKLKISEKEKLMIFEHAQEDLNAINNILLHLTKIGDSIQHREMMIQNNLVHYDVFQLIFLLLNRNFHQLKDAFSSIREKIMPSYFLILMTQEIIDIIQLKQMKPFEQTQYLQEKRIFGIRKQQKLAGLKNFSFFELKVLYQRLFLLYLKLYHTNTDAFWQEMWQTITHATLPFKYLETNTT